MPKISALVLAAGESKRIPGKNKLLLPFAGKTIVECTVDTVLQAAVDDVILVLGHEAETIKKVVGDRPIKIAFNPDYRNGMAGSIHTGLTALSPTATAVMICLVDQPLIQSAELNLLITAFSQAKEKSIAVPVFKGQRGNPVIFDLRYRAEMLTLKGDVGCKPIIARHPEAVVEVEMPTGNILEDADTSEAYARLVMLSNH
ncbi:MAG: nucleotidyltransferase family protein [candidate division KSB1 bacterium]|nr:nucleotidyltransferase family protein [candidate division KSB1 bacterium]MDZ7366423.1 nucleotidyltransferase family protein [candidate division KSB1 bacterium]MDZ7404615.1 nucleotidyltransferase family protein [candidate division KSB1 bacterium]